MVNFSFLEKLIQLKDIIMSSSFFLFSIIISIILLITMLISVKSNRRIPKLIFIISWIFVITFIIFRYHDSLWYIFDRLFGRIVEEIYFPSLTVYTCVLIITNLIIIISFFRKKMNNIFKIINLTVAMEINFLFILILDTIVKNNIDIYAGVITYSEPKLLVLLEFSMFLFLTWIFLISILLLIKKYGVNTVLVNLFKESDYEVIDIEFNKKEVNDKINNIEIDAEIIDIENNIDIIDI